MAVSPSSSSMLTSAPSATSSCTRSMWPCVTASCSGVWFRLLRMLMSQRPCERERQWGDKFYFSLQQKSLNYILKYKHIKRTCLQLTSLMRISATSRWLLRAARCNAEKPSSFLTSTSCRARARIFSVALQPGQTTQDSIRKSAQHSTRLKLRTVISFILQAAAKKKKTT